MNVDRLIMCYSPPPSMKEYNLTVSSDLAQWVASEPAMVSSRGNELKQGEGSQRRCNQQPIDLTHVLDSRSTGWVLIQHEVDEVSGMHNRACVFHTSFKEPRNIRERTNSTGIGRRIRQYKCVKQAATGKPNPQTEYSPSKCRRWVGDPAW